MICHFASDVALKVSSIRRGFPDIDFSLYYRVWDCFLLRFMATILTSKKVIQCDKKIGNLGISLSDFKMILAC